VARALVLAATLATACGHDEARAPRWVIACLGDSITYGTTRSSRGTIPGERDPLGGYPGRLARRLGPGVQVVNRGIGGATTEDWLRNPGGADGAAVWSLLPGLWPDFGRPEVPAGATSVARAVAVLARPDVAIILLGVNDLFVSRSQAHAVADGVAERLAALRRDVLAVAPHVLVATVLPSRRDAPAAVDRLNTAIRTGEPDYLPLAERFAAGGWEHLLGDDVHPNADGYELLASVVAEELHRRGLDGRDATTR